MLFRSTPGKDTGNERLYDRIGGVNAATQEDGYPGYGGVFIESLFGFSEHPGEHAEAGNPNADPSFDLIFDPFPVRAGDDAAPQRAVFTLAGKTLAEIEKQALIETLEASQGNKAMAARKLGISERSIYNKLKRHELSY